MGIVFLGDGVGEVQSQLRYQALVNIGFDSFQPPHPQTFQKKKKVKHL